MSAVSYANSGFPAGSRPIHQAGRRFWWPFCAVTRPRYCQSSTINSHCWRAYNTLGLQGYTHLTVNHSINFVDPNTGACTNHIENYWRHAKQRNRREYGTARTQLDSYLVEYMWRARYHKNMQAFVEHVCAVYPPY